MGGYRFVSTGSTVVLIVSEMSKEPFSPTLPVIPSEAIMPTTCPYLANPSQIDRK
jgi:hypothetical protein